MTDSEFRDWLAEEVLNGRMTAGQRDDLLKQKQLFDRHCTEIEQLYQQQVVGYVNGVRQVGENAHEFLATAKRSYRGCMIYFEPVGFPLC